LKAISIPIIGLSNTSNHFDYELGDAFFEKYSGGMISGGQFDIAITLDKHETFIEATFNIRGYVRLICDRSLKPFEQEVNTLRKIVFKYGEVEEELSDEIVVIRRDRAMLELSQYVNEFIVLELPMKRLHPEFRGEEEDDGEGKMVYRTTDEPTPDPRWEKLKKLK
jgi:uncharacterized protein